jgi:transcriptional regulator with XRE-family HTH domain
MRDHWPEQIAAFRRSQSLTQQDLADILGVSAPTVSRWESGAQTPDIAHIGTIRRLLGLNSLNSLDEWVFRVNRSQGHEILLDSNEKVVAVSEPVLAFRNLTLDQGLGRDFRMVLPEATALESAAEHERVGAAADRAKLFDRKIRLIKFDTEVRYGSNSLRVSYDIWPILVSGGDIYALMVFVATGTISDSEWRGNYRILSYQAYPTPTLEI